jgi:hypothetical protein
MENEMSEVIEQLAAEPQVEEKQKSKKVAKVADKGDVIVSTAHTMENLTKEKAYALAQQLAENVEFTFFQLGGVLSVIQSHGWYHDEGYETFRDFVEAEYGLQYRKAVYLIAIYNGLVESGVPWEKVKHLGWTKLKELAHILTPTNVDEWMGKVDGLTVLQLQQLLKSSGSPDVEAGVEPQQEANKITTLTIKVHSDQKEVIREAIEKAKTESATEYDSVALENICMQYLGEPSKQRDLVAEMKSRGPMEILNVFEAAFPEVELSVNKDSLPK